MRMLGDGHTVMFFAPPEVVHGISALKPSSDPSEEIHADDILRWVMTNTCKQIIHHGPRWAMQGVDHESRERAWAQCKEFADSKPPAGLVSPWLQPDARALVDMYGPKSIEDASKKMSMELPDAIYQRCLELGVANIDEHKLDEEQQREVAAELEIEPQIERPPKGKAEQHEVARDVRSFIQRGHFLAESAAFVRLCQVVGDCIPGFNKRAAAWSMGLFATRDFEKTVRFDKSAGGAPYLRPINWIISGGMRMDVSAEESSSVLVIISQYEANELLSLLRKSKRLQLHVYAPRLAQEMTVFDDLTYHCIPSLPAHSTMRVDPQLILELNILSGQLYFSTYDAYLRFCEFFRNYDQ